MGTPEAKPETIRKHDLKLIRAALKVASNAGNPELKQDYKRLHWALNTKEGLAMLSKLALNAEIKLMADESREREKGPKSG